MKSLMKWMFIPTVLILTQCGSEGLSSWVISKEQEYEMGMEFDRVTRDSLKIKKLLFMMQKATKQTKLQNMPNGGCTSIRCALKCKNSKA